MLVSGSHFVLRLDSRFVVGFQFRLNFVTCSTGSASPLQRHPLYDDNLASRRPVSGLKVFDLPASIGVLAPVTDPLVELSASLSPCVRLAELFIQPRAEPAIDSVVTGRLQNLVRRDHVLSVRMSAAFSGGEGLRHDVAFVVIVAQEMAQFVHHGREQIHVVLFTLVARPAEF